MKSVPLLVETSECKQFKCIYLKNKAFCLNLFLGFSNLHKISNIFKKKMTLIDYVFPILPTTKNVLKHGKRAETLIQS